MPLDERINDLATAIATEINSDRAALASKAHVVNVSTGSEARPDAGVVFWMGGTTQPVNMANGDVWFALDGQPATGVAPTITTTSLNGLTVGVAYSQTVTATGSTPITWAVSVGTLPAGLSLNTSTGAVTGTPTTSGAYSFTLSATNSIGSDTQAFSGSVSAAGVAPTITTTTLDAQTQGTAFTQTLAATGSTPITWGISAGTPNGLQINSTTGVLSGTPLASGAYDFTVQATNAFGSDTQQFTGTVAASGAALHSIFAATNPYTYTANDDTSTLRLANAFYCYGDATGYELVGMRIYRIAPFPTSLTAFAYTPPAGTAPNLLVPAQSKAVTGLVAGWNDILFDTPMPLTVGVPIWVGYDTGDGGYMHANSGSIGFTTATDGTKMVLSEQTISTAGGDVKRSYLSIDGGASGPASGMPFYGVDVLYTVD